MVAAGQFRADLYYRLNVLPIRLPALRDRVTDLEPLVMTLTDEIARRNGMPRRDVSAAAPACLARRPWPGNIRELRNVLEQASLMTDDLVLLPEHLGEPAGGSALGADPAAPDTAAGQECAGGDATNPARGVRPLAIEVAQLEGRAIRNALQATGGNKLAASRLLGISRATRYERLAQQSRGPS
jgi:DNA-binding NtrC family response regulator